MECVLGVWSRVGFRMRYIVSTLAVDRVLYTRSTANVDQVYNTGFAYITYWKFYVYMDGVIRWMRVCRLKYEVIWTGWTEFVVESIEFSR